jgi:hypothetical protein
MDEQQELQLSRRSLLLGVRKAGGQDAVPISMKVTLEPYGRRARGRSPVGNESGTAS